MARTMSSSSLEDVSIDSAEEEEEEEGESYDVQDLAPPAVGIERKHSLRKSIKAKLEALDKIYKPYSM